MSWEDIELFNVTDEGELKQMAISEPIKDMLNNDMVVLLVTNSQKKIYLWKGQNAKVRRKFIAARVSQDLRGKKGLSFKVESIDHGDEPSAFINIVGGQIPVSGGTSAEFAAMPSASPKVKDLLTSPSSDLPSQTTIQPASTTPQGLNVGQAQVPDNIEAGVKAIINEIENIPPPTPYHREIVFIGPYAFSIVETKKVLFGEEQIERKWELVSPPEGQFLAEGYISRAIIRSGKVLAVELLKGEATEPASDTQIQIFKIKYQK